jgi:antitoxin ParD1/3/4
VGSVAGRGVSGRVYALTTRVIGGYSAGMETTSITIDLSKETKEFIDQQAAANGFGSSADYVRSLLRVEEDRAWRKEIDKLLLEALNSGPATPLTKQDFEDIRKEGTARLNTTVGKEEGVCGRRFTNVSPTTGQDREFAFRIKESSK